MKQVLVIEDDPTWAMVLERYCRDEGAKVRVAVSPQLALDMIDEIKPDVVILDMLLAAETGMALLNEMRGYDDLTDIPVVVCTSVEGMNMKQLAPLGVTAVLDKTTMTPDEMKCVLRGELA